jgi:hypothetical protein
MNAAVVIILIILLEIVLVAGLFYAYVLFCDVEERPIGSKTVYKIVIVG